MKTRKILAALMAMSMVAAMSPMSASAIATETVTSAPAEGSVVADGDFEGTVDTDVFHVVLPTVTTELDFIMDPQGLIKATQAAKYTSATGGFDEGTLFFSNTTNKQNGKDYSNTSDKLTITNKSSFDVDVKISATVSDNTGVALTSDKTFADDTSASLYLALTDGTNTEAIGENGATLTAKIDKAPVGAYKYNYNSGSSKYEYILDTGASPAPTFAKYEFQLTGATNAKGDWSGVDAAIAPKATVVWNVAKHVDSYLSTKTVSTSSPSVTVTLPDGVGVDGIVFKSSDGNKEISFTSTYYSLSGSTYTFVPGVVATSNSGATITFKFSDGRTEVVTIS